MLNIIKFVIKVMTTCSLVAWDILVFFADVIVTDKHSTYTGSDNDLNNHYNRHTGEIDFIKRAHGSYIDDHCVPPENLNERI